MFNDAEGPFDETGTEWLVGWVGECGIGFEALTQHHLGREPVQHALPQLLNIMPIDLRQQKLQC